VCCGMCARQDFVHGRVGWEMGRDIQAHACAIPWDECRMGDDRDVQSVLDAEEKEATLSYYTTLLWRQSITLSFLGRVFPVPAVAPLASSHAHSVLT